MEKAWNELGLSPELLSLIEKAGYRAPTPVQAEAIPYALEGHDIIASSQTGSGKTATFVLPTVDRFSDAKGLFCLVLAPTREIAQQTHAVFETFGGPLGIKSIVLIGGIHMSLDKKALETYPQVIVATPGRLCDHLERGHIWLEYIKVLILDEADRMLDMGFADQLSKIMEHVPNDRQTMVFSATYGPSVTKLVDRIMYEPKRVTIGETSSAPKRIVQKVIFLQEEDKFSALMKLIREEKGTIIIFTRSKDRASRVWRSLHARTVYDATYIHSDCTQSHRETALADFKSGKYRILVATDVAGRGIDVDDIAHVVNYDLSMEPEDYIHRIGRTGRRGKEGLATTLATHRDRDILRRIEKLVGEAMNLNLPERSAAPAGGGGSSRSGGRRDQPAKRSEGRSASALTGEATEEAKAPRPTPTAGPRVGGPTMNAPGFVPPPAPARAAAAGPRPPRSAQPGPVRADEFGTRDRSASLDLPDDPENTADDGMAAGSADASGPKRRRRGRRGRKPASTPAQS